jgi:hypothetical protein
MIEQETRVSLNDQPVDDYSAVEDDFMNGLKSKIHEIYTATSFPQQTESEDCPSHCPFLIHCGRKARNANNG